jgi:hypothetical protein
LGGENRPRIACGPMVPRSEAASGRLFCVLARTGGVALARGRMPARTGRIPARTGARGVPVAGTPSPWGVRRCRGRCAGAGGPGRPTPTARPSPRRAVGLGRPEGSGRRRRMKLSRGWAAVARGDGAASARAA